MEKLQNFFIDEPRRRKLNKILEKVNSHADTISKLTNDELRSQTVKFKEQLASGATLDDILPEAYATVREVNKRLLGMYPYDVQVLGAIVLHQGNVAEMKTGEGKTLTATMPLYLNALSGKSTILITTNEYLALRDYEEMKKVYTFLGLTSAEALKFGKKEGERVSALEKRLVYQSDIVYTTNTALAFDYLAENLTSSKEDRYLPEFNYVIIDEVDEILLDAAQTPLIISGAPKVQSNLYHISNVFIETLEQDIHYKYDNKKKETWFTTRGYLEAERFFDLGSLFHKNNKEYTRHITLALRANKLFESGKDYVVDDDKVKLLDRSTGRMLEGVKLQAGQHQAIEAKENVKITPVMRSMASITYQNFFKLFKKISGMTGTGKVAEEEFIKTYNMAVIQIPTNKPVIRIDYPDAVYATLPEKINATLELVKEYHSIGRPILLITGNVDLSVIYSELLLNEGIAHNVLNAHNVAKEAEIIKEAGQKNSVTVATIMAGRGTDIKLGDGVAELGGLAVIGTERMKSRRIDLQLIGRSGRQGDPGMSKFFVSLEDNLLLEYGGEKVKAYYYKYARNKDYSNPKEITNKKLLKLIDSSQGLSDSKAASSRSTAVEFDESLRLQRKVVYAERDKIINGENFSEDYINSIVNEGIVDAVNNFELIDKYNITRYVLDNLTYDFRKYDFFTEDKNILKRNLFNIYNSELNKKKQLLLSENQLNEFYRYALLRAIDNSWIEQVDNLEQLKLSVSSRGLAQRNVIYEFYKEAAKSFEYMRSNIRENLIRNISLSKIVIDKEGNLELIFP